MRTAICISGQPRHLKYAVDSIKANLVNPNENVDIFLHAWFNPSSIGLPWDSAQPSLDNANGLVLPNTKELLLSLNPKDYIIEEQVDFSEYTKGFKDHPTARQDKLASNFYSVYTANSLKSKYEKSNNFVYDCVIRCRYDLVYESPIVVSGYLNALSGSIVVPKNYQEDQDRLPWNCYKGMVDVFALSNSQLMDKYSETFLKMSIINRSVEVCFGEVYLGVNTRILNNISLYYAPINIDLVRRTRYANI